MLESGTLSNKKAIIDRYVKQITLHGDKISIELNATDTYTITEEITRLCLAQVFARIAGFVSL